MSWAHGDGGVGLGQRGDSRVVAKAGCPGYKPVGGAGPASCAPMRQAPPEMLLTSSSFAARASPTAAAFMGRSCCRTAAARAEEVVAGPGMTRVRCRVLPRGPDWARVTAGPSASFLAPAGCPLHVPRRPRIVVLQGHVGWNVAVPFSGGP